MSDHKEKDRIESVDILRAVGILIMVMGHVGFGGKFDRYIHSFHMPVFFLISGSLFVSKRETGVFTLILKKAKRLLIPYVFYAVFNYIFWLLIGNAQGTPWYVPLLRAVTYNTSGLPICGALWFLTAMFFAESFYMILDRIIKNGYIRPIITVSLAVVASFLQNRTDYRLPLTIDTAVICMGFFEIGRVFTNVDKTAAFKKLSERKSILFITGVLLVIINAVLSFVNPYVNIKSGWYGFVPLFWINAIIGSAGFLALSVWFDKTAAPKSSLRGFLVTTGRTSMIFLGLNQLVIMLIELCWRIMEIRANFYVEVAVIFLVSAAVLYLISFAANRIKNKTIRTLLGI